MSDIKSICFHAGGDSRISSLYFELAKYLKAQHGVESLFYCYNQEVYNYLSDKGYSCILENKYDNIAVSDEEKNSLKQYFQSINLLDFHQIYFSEAAFAGNQPSVVENLKTRVYQRIKLIKEVSESNFEADVFVDFAGDEIPHNIFNIIARLKGKRLVRWRETVFPERIGFVENELGIWQIKNESSTISENGVEYVNDFIEEYLNQKKVFWGSPKEREFKLKVDTRNIYKKVFDKDVWVRLLKRTKRTINKRSVRSLYDDIQQIDDLSFFYFPLHYPIDSQLTYRGRPFIDQVSFALNIANFLGENDYLVIKEHPHALGAISKNELRRLKNNKKVKLIQPWENSHVILKKSKCVLVINSTVALEAIYNRIPVISFGKSYFSGHGLFEEFSAFYDLYKLYNWQPELDFEEKYEKLLKFLSSGFSQSYPIASRELLQDSNNITLDGMLIFGKSLMKYLEIDE